MTVRLLAASSPGEVRIAAVESERLLDYALWRPGAPDGVGDLYRGRIETVLPALGGAFVALGSGSGFLPLRDNEPHPGDGDPVLVRVVRSAQGGKGPRLRVCDESGFERAGVPALLAAGPDPLAKLAAAYPNAPITIDHTALAAEVAPGLRHRIERAATVMPASVEEQVEALSVTVVALPGGMTASIHPTPALVAIDLDGGGTSAGRQGKQVAQFAANRAAIGPLLHQLRLRNLSGAILLDLAGLAARKRAALRPEIEAALALDPLQPRLLGFTALGLAEILRPRVHPPLHELLAGPHAAALAALRAADRIAAVPPHRLPGLVVGLDVGTALQRDRSACDALARRAGRPISIRMDPSLPVLAWNLDHG